jgi:hypothetical protein
MEEETINQPAGWNLGGRRSTIYAVQMLPVLGWHLHDAVPGTRAPESRIHGSSTQTQALTQPTLGQSSVFQISARRSVGFDALNRHV